MRFVLFFEGSLEDMEHRDVLLLMISARDATRIVLPAISTPTALLRS